VKDHIVTILLGQPFGFKDRFIQFQTLQ
jgi:hypothetical protein